MIKQYLEAYLRQRPLFLSLIRSREAEIFSKYLPFKKPVLDVGVGDGFFAKIAFGHLDIGMDIAESRIKEAEKLKVYDKLIVYGGKTFPFPKNHFQTVVSNCVLEHVATLPEVLSEIRRVLVPGGRAYLSVMAHPWEEHLLGSILLGNTYKQFMRKTQVHLNLYSYNQWQTAFIKAGFKIDEAIGYLDDGACRLIDLCHYVSIPNLISYKLIGNWMPWPILSKIYPTTWLAKIVSHKVAPEKAGAIFFVLKK